MNKGTPCLHFQACIWTVNCGLLDIKNEEKQTNNISKISSLHLGYTGIRCVSFF